MIFNHFVQAGFSKLAAQFKVHAKSAKYYLFQ